MNIEEVSKILVGKTIESVVEGKNADCSIIITTSEGDVLDVGFSACEGSGYLNSFLIDELN